MPRAGLIYGPEFHHLDHLAPLCAELSIPLIVTDTQMASQATRFYPDLQLLHWHPHETPEKLVTHFDTIFYSTPRILFEQVFFLAQALHKKRIRTIWCPHGNSDKGRHSPFMEALAEEELLLTYGLRIETFLKEKGIHIPTLRVGNYRLAYYYKHQAFYDALMPSLKSPTLLYAPTWQDLENSSSFPNIWPHLLNVPDAFSLIIKLHPNLYPRFPKEIERLRTNAPDNVTLLEDFPPIYPLLAKTDLYIGDKSSIGYDFLAFNKPLLLLTQSELTQVGTYLPPEEHSHLFTHCQKLLEATHKPDPTLYRETYSPADLSQM